MASYDEIVSGLGDLSSAERRRTLEFLRRDLDATDQSGDQSRDNGGDGSSSARGAYVRPPLRKLRLFSGKYPTTSGEVDYETWRLQATQMIEDGNMAETDKKMVLLQSLLRPALDTVSSISRTSSAIDCVEMLETIYGRVEDGHDLVVAFHTTYQEEKETASAYLNRLYLLLVQAADRRGLKVKEIPIYLLRQFMRGCQDDSFVQRLHLEARLDDPWEFGEFLLSIRKEECRRTEKRLRMSRTTVQVEASARNTQEAARGKQSSPDKKTRELEVQVNQLTTQLKELQAKSFAPAAVRGKTEKESDSSSGSSGSNAMRKRKPFFCYRCGTDGHRKATCLKEANPELVFQKLN